MKRLSHAKTRLSSALPRAELALAFALDTIAAARNCRQVTQITVVTDDSAVAAAVPPDISVSAEGPKPGLNAAVSHAARRLGTGPVAVLTADLPALRSDQLREALRQAAHHPVGFVPDAARAGTVLLTATHPSDLSPRFGTASAAAHSVQGAVRLEGVWPGLRRDVDTPTDLAAALHLGVGVHTARLMHRRP